MLTAQPKPTSLRRPEAISGFGRHQRLTGKAASFSGFRPSRRAAVIRAVISSGDSKTGVETAEKSVESNGSLVSSSGSGSISVRAVITIRKKMKERLSEKIEDQWESFINGIGRGILIQLISEDIDPVTKSGKSVESFVRGWLPKLSNNPHVVEYGADLTVPQDFGQPGAILVTNFHDKEFFLMEVVVHGFSQGPIFFWADTWIHSRKDNPESRIIFKNQAYLPSQTPPGIKDLRHEDLLSLRGNRKEERKLHERVYDYDVYNDLGNPDKSEELARPVAGTEERPYPRRCRTGRPPTLTESRNPIQFMFLEMKRLRRLSRTLFSAGRLKALLHNLIPLIVTTLSSSDVPFTNFSDIDKLYNDGVLLKEEEPKEAKKNKILATVMNQMFTVGDKLLKYDLPAIIKRDRFAWLRDNEFARQTLAGVNPVNIALLKILKYMASRVGNHQRIDSKRASRISVEEAIKEKRLFILDYHDLLLPFIEKLNALPDRKAYASRTVFYYSETGVLRPIVIELSLPPTSSSPRNKYIFTHGHDATTNWIWKLAKAHVCSNDAGVHQLVNHWLKTHACMEPYIIATHRQLSSMHPIYKLLHPHMRYTMEINALARQSLINGGGIIEACFSPGKYAMELSSAAYKSLWRFDVEALPADLLQRGMAVEDPTVPGGVKLVIEDYPYAADGLLIWAAIKELVESYVEHYYSEPNSISSDVELQAGGMRSRTRGTMTKGKSHAINFGQYPFGGYPPNRPTLMRKLIPQEGDAEYEKFLQNPEYTFLTSLPTQLQATKVMAVQDTLSTHSPDEEYLNQLHHIHRLSFNDPEVQKLFERFSVKLEEIERIINQRNKNIQLKNRNGAGVPPYELLLPSSSHGVTGRGIPNSISI
ncbi:Lipoxygenase 6, chloroplastic [Sesamum angolense]|uniref:Lipoxygenase n=1 Tax=Sesamum angolense TaxID=2727404 RepID=A0AAE1WZQ2_9LAMI|nr:Lipoxygenase 6, chloroplastic [Sesamum angolense]